LRYFSGLPVLWAAAHGTHIIENADFDNMAKAKKVEKLEVGDVTSSAYPTSPGQAETDFRFSGHQTFPLRIAWLPKAVAEIAAGRDPLTDIDEGITQLGLGKNMVEALRCWIEAFQIARRAERGWQLTRIGSLVFHPTEGLDSYYEDVSTSWLLHWLISTNTESPFFAWECLFNRWPSTEFSTSQVIEAFQKETSRTARPASAVTMRQHWEVFLHSYRRPAADKGEDHLDSAMSVLRLIQEFGERPNASGKWETVYSFDQGRKRAIPEQLFAFFLHDWWNRKYPNERTVPLGEIVLGEHSPGRLLKMQESEIIHRVTDLAARQTKVFHIVESTNLRQLHRLQKRDGLNDLEAAYRTPRFT
jgi:hypothetical protein